MNVGQSVDCLYCMSAGSYQLRLDVKGRPFFVCSRCGTRTFLRGVPSLGLPTVLWGAITAAARDHNEVAARELVAGAVHHG
jgi:hypothetical protein